MIRADGVSLSIGGRVILQDVSCAVRPGRILVAMGKNGAGKSTLLQCLSGSLGADAGTVVLGGRAIASFSPPDLATRRAVLAQSVHLGFPLSVTEVVEIGCYGRYHELTNRRRAARIDHYLRLLELEPLRHRSFPTLSGGEQKRVLLAKCLLQLDEDATVATADRYLLLDEPTAALDVEQQYRFVRLLTQLARERGLGIFAVVHDLNLAARFADDLIFLRDGRTVAAGPTTSVLNQTNIRATFDVDCLIQEHPHFAGPLITTLPYENPQLATA